MPRNDVVVCDGCGGSYGQGYDLLNHRKVCKSAFTSTSEHEDSGSGSEGEGIDIDLFDTDVGEVVIAVPPNLVRDGTNTVDSHLHELDRLGTLDGVAVMKYMGWGRLVLTGKQQEILRFLRSVESGGGSSRVSTYEALKYAKSLGGRGDWLPKTVKSCWSQMLKVRMQCTL